MESGMLPTLFDWSHGIFQLHMTIDSHEQRSAFLTVEQHCESREPGFYTLSVYGRNRTANLLVGSPMPYTWTTEAPPTITEMQPHVLIISSMGNL